MGIWLVGICWVTIIIIITIIISLLPTRWPMYHHYDHHHHNYSSNHYDHHYHHYQKPYFQQCGQSRATSSSMINDQWLCWWFSQGLPSPTSPSWLLPFTSLSISLLLSSERFVFFWLAFGLLCLCLACFALFCFAVVIRKVPDSWFGLVWFAQDYFDLVWFGLVSTSLAMTHWNCAQEGLETLICLGQLVYLLTY